MVVYRVDPEKVFQEAVNRAQSMTADLRVPLILISQSWFKTNQAIFALKGPGKYKDLKPRTKTFKEKYGSAYPILLGVDRKVGKTIVQGGRLMRSITDPSSPDSINLIVNKNVLTLGTKVPYAAPQQFGSKRGLPARPLVLLGAEQVAPSGLNRRLDAWVKILADWAEAKSKEALG